MREQKEVPVYIHLVPPPPPGSLSGLLAHLAFLRLYEILVEARALRANTDLLRLGLWFLGLRRLFGGGLPRSFFRRCRLALGGV